MVEWEIGLTAWWWRSILLPVLSCHWRWSCGSSESRDKREEEAIEEGINHQHLVKLLSNMDTRLAMGARCSCVAHSPIKPVETETEAEAAEGGRGRRRLFGTAEVSKLDSNAGEGKGREEKGSKFGGKAPESLTYLSTLAYWLWSLQESGRRFGSCKKCEDSLATTPTPTTTTTTMLPKGACEQWIGQTQIQTKFASLSLTHRTAPHRSKLKLSSTSLHAADHRSWAASQPASEQSSDRVVKLCQAKGKCGGGAKTAPKQTLLAAYTTIHYITSLPRYIHTCIPKYWNLCRKCIGTWRTVNSLV